jgi:hypothetical protein
MSTTTRVSRVSDVPVRLVDQGIGGGDCRPHPIPSPPSRSVSLANPLAARVRNLCSLEPGAELAGVLVALALVVSCIGANAPAA